MAKSTENIVNRSFEWQSEAQPELTIAGKSAKRYPGWEAGEVPPASEMEKIEELPDIFKEQIKVILDKKKELEEKLEPLESKLARVKKIESTLDEKIDELEESGNKELTPLVKKFYEDVKIKTPELGNAAFNSMKEVGIAINKWKELNTIIGVKVGILETVQVEPSDAMKLQLIMDYMKKEHPVIARELEGYINLTKDTIQRSLAPRVLVKNLNEQRIINTLVFKYIQAEYPSLYKSALIKESKNVYDVCKLTNLDYIKEDLRQYKNKIEKAVRAKLIKESGISEFLTMVKHSVLNFFGKLNLIASQGKAIVKHIEHVNSTLDTLIKMLDGDLDPVFVKRILS